MEKQIFGLTLKSLIIGLFVTVIAIYLGMLVNPLTGTLTYAGDDVQSGGPFGSTNGAFLSFFVLIFFVSLLPARLRIKPQEYSVILAMLMAGLIPTGMFAVSAALGVFPNLYGAPSASAMHQVLQPGRTGIPLSPPFTSEIFEPYFMGRASVPWGAWAVPILSWSAIFICYFLLLFFLALLLRKPVIETQRMAFPYAKIPLTLIGESTSKILGERPSILKNKRLWIGVLIGFVGAAPVWLPIFFKVGSLMGHIGPWTSMAVCDFNLWIPPGGWASVIRFKLLNNPGYVPFNVNYSPGVIALHMLLPMDVLFTMSFFIILLQFVIGNVAAFMGIIPSYDHFAQLSHGSQYPQFQFGAMTPGAFIGLGVWALFLARHHIIGTLRGVLKGTEEEGISPRLMWGGVVLFSAALVGLMSIVGMPAWLAIVLIILILITQIGFIVMRGQMGSNSLNFSMGAPNSIMIYDIGGFVSAGTFTSTACAATMLFTGTLGGFTAEQAPAAMYMESLKVGFESKGKPRANMSGVIVATVIGVVLSCVFFLINIYWLGSSVGVTGPFSLHGLSPGDQVAESRIGWATEGMEPDWAMGGKFVDWMGWFFGGLVVAIVLSAIRMVWLRFPIVPSVFPVAAWYAGWYWFGGNPIIALIGKFVILRLGGTKLYEMTIPLWVGMTIGFWAGLFTPIAYYNIQAILGIVGSTIGIW